MTFAPQVKLERTTPPTGQPVTLGEARAHLNITTREDDTVLSSMIDDATGWCENYSGRSFMPQTWTLFMDVWRNTFVVPVSPAVSVAIKYDDTDGIEQTLPAGDYIADTRAFPVRVVLNPGTALPDLGDGFNVVRCEMSAGWSDADSVPSPIKAGVLLMVGFLYENREAATAAKIEELPVPFGVRSFLNGYRLNY
jgi:uncharacterized phiE125 gp8 family phage protein